MGESLAPSLQLCLRCDPETGLQLPGSRLLQTSSRQHPKRCGCCGERCPPSCGVHPTVSSGRGSLSQGHGSVGLGLRISEELNQLHTHGLNRIITINYTGLNSGHALLGTREMLLLQAAGCPGEPAQPQRRRHLLGVMARDLTLHVTPGPEGRGCPSAKQQLTTACLSCADHPEGNPGIKGDSSHGFLSPFVRILVQHYVRAAQLLKTCQAGEQRSARRR